MADRDPVPLPAEVRAKLAELELELSEGESVVTLTDSVQTPDLMSSAMRGRAGLIPSDWPGEFTLCHNENV